MNNICRLLIFLVLILTLFLIKQLFTNEQKEHFHGKRRRNHRKRKYLRSNLNYGNDSWWYWGPRWAYMPTVSYPCNPFWNKNCPAYLYNPYSYLYSYEEN